MIWVAKNLYFFNCLLDGAHTKVNAKRLLLTLYNRYASDSARQ